MLFRTIASAFFLEASDPDDLAMLVERAGMTDVAPLDELARVGLGFHRPDRQVLGGMWGAFRETWAIVDDVERLRCLQLYSAATRYLDAVRATRTGNDADDGPLPAHYRTFRDACLSLNPRAAFLDTQPHYEDERWDDKQGSRAFVLAQASLVTDCDADALVGRYFYALYLDTEMAACLTHEPAAFDRGVVELPNGRLIFAREGPAHLP